MASYPRSWTVDSGGTADGAVSGEGAWSLVCSPHKHVTITGDRDYTVIMPAYKCRHCRDGAILPSIVVEESADPGPSLEDRVIQF